MIVAFHEGSAEGYTTRRSSSNQNEALAETWFTTNVPSDRTTTISDDNTDKSTIFSSTAFSSTTFSSTTFSSDNIASCANDRTTSFSGDNNTNYCASDRSNTFSSDNTKISARDRNNTFPRDILSL